MSRKKKNIQKLSLFYYIFYLIFWYVGGDQSKKKTEQQKNFIQTLVDCGSVLRKNFTETVCLS